MKWECSALFPSFLGQSMTDAPAMDKGNFSFSPKGRSFRGLVSRQFTRGTAACANAQVDQKECR